MVRRIRLVRKNTIKLPENLRRREELGVEQKMSSLLRHCRLLLRPQWCSGQLIKVEQKKNDQKKDEGKTFEDLDELEKQKTLSNVTDKVAVQANTIDTNDKSTTQNCPNCAIATELRLRGYDVKAQHLTGGQAYVKFLKGAFTENPHWEAGNNLAKDGFLYVKKRNETTEAYKERRLQELSKEIATTSGKNTSGAIVADSALYSMGHVFNYVVDGKGNVTYLDGQSNNTNAADRNINALDSSFRFNYARLDNLSVSEGALNYVRKP